ncbi:cysteine desulfurase family protein [Tuwongella immobilis]|uniref:Aminotransferase class V domain-containing protein n=1 Tax=Tuwongella immobilis TaxID=692036 RepID=A0A6C2YUE4_9BACT|nr:cysteine desulfurase family protein [Tuwongella immobilis]VIP04977.1 cysteine desulfurase : Cysteine desulfurase family protein OS=Singulisphaera acidiphila (strain ATCC BAA-1392 / DSM 18658 / VKM B-2454 / MOB10) GN=Sinac_0245 PE=4 SV=1: Aminotran_5 [Tuwongella immobilis]VTS07312.1 cysteine desulfurase : Cysteine desulfurase family protein OS=Singulisphaera acidiphila (strain ATCC BAA-1392 / DSM 18658 / VKM B-2454 / MOB10) GN=Sinac_0245 PE=4 SV=1: Aminotran_5 [Tuwongella immobilis]
METIYLDHHATTPMRPEVWDAMRPFACELFGNPASAHQVGRKARQALEDARELVATCLGASPDEVIFTSGATEANNLAILGLAGDSPGQILGSRIEHPCVVEPLLQLANRGWRVEWMTPGLDGVIPLEMILKRHLHADTRLIALMAVNHETGAIQPVRELGRNLPRGTRWHCDAAQAAGKFPIHFRQWGCTSLTISAHKFAGPKGVGALLLRAGQPLKPLTLGGHQQQGRRPGTESVALAVGLATALQLAVHEMESNRIQLCQLRRRLADGLAELGAIVQSPPMNSEPELIAGLSSPAVLNVAFPEFPADLLLMKLDLAGIACSTGSACASGSLRPSAVLEAMQLPVKQLRSSLRFSLAPSLTPHLIDEALFRIRKVIASLRQADADL